MPSMATAGSQDVAPPSRDTTRTTVIVLPPSDSARFEQSMRQQQVRDQLQKNQLQEQLRQNTMEAIRRPSADHAAHQKHLRQAEEAERALYRSRQRGELDRYQNAVAPQPVIVHTEPAPAGSG